MKSQQCIDFLELQTHHLTDFTGPYWTMPFSSPIIHGITWIEGRFGYNIHAQNFFTSLSRHLPTLVSPLMMLEGPFLEDQAAIKSVFKSGDVTSIALLYGCFCEEVLRNAPGKKIGYTVWEATRLPDDWMPSLAALDEVWVPSTWGRDVMIGNGIESGKVKVVPEGVDPSIFHPEVEPAGVIDQRSGFKFLNIGKFEHRKGTRALIQAFDREFDNTDDALLVLMCDNPHDPDFDLVQELRTMGLKHPEKLVFIPPLARHEMLAPLYTACDAFVLPTKAEGWGLPIIEAMACGLPVITTGYSAPTDYLGDTAYRIDHALIPVDDPFFETADGDLGLWADPDIEHMQTLMRHVFENRDEAHMRGRQGGKDVRENYSWDAAAQKAVHFLTAP